MASGVGFIALFGVAVQNGIIMVLNLNRMRKSGFELHEAARRACAGIVQERRIGAGRGATDCEIFHEARIGSGSDFVDDTISTLVANANEKDCARALGLQNIFSR